MLQSNPTTPCVPASPHDDALGRRSGAGAGGLLAAAGSTFISSVGPEESTDTKIKEDKDEMGNEKANDVKENRNLNDKTEK